MDRTKQVPSQLRDKITALIGKYQSTVSGDSAIAKFLGTKIDPEVTVFDPANDSILDLNEMLDKGGACTARSLGGKQTTSFFGKSYGATNPEDSPACAFAKDSKAGGSVHFLVHGEPNKNAYNRLYIAIDNAGQPFAFYDCIEAKNQLKTSMTEYTNDGTADLLLGSIAASIVIANRLGLGKIAFGEPEVIDVARNLGFGERRLFSSESSNACQKLGYIGDTTHNNTGPYVWMMQRDKTRRAIDPRLYHSSTLQTVISQAYQVMERIDGNKKSVKTMREDYETYFAMVQTVLQETKDLMQPELFENVSADVELFQNKYHLNLSGKMDVEPAQIAPVPSPQMPIYSQHAA